MTGSFIQKSFGEHAELVVQRYRDSCVVRFYVLRWKPDPDRWEMCEGQQSKDRFEEMPHLGRDSHDLISVANAMLDELDRVP